MSDEYFSPQSFYLYDLFNSLKWLSALKLAPGPFFSVLNIYSPTLLSIIFMEPATILF